MATAPSALLSPIGIDSVIFIEFERQWIRRVRHAAANDDASGNPRTKADDIRPTGGPRKIVV